MSFQCSGSLIGLSTGSRLRKGKGCLFEGGHGELNFQFVIILFHYFLHTGDRFIFAPKVGRARTETECSIGK